MNAGSEQGDQRVLFRCQKCAVEQTVCGIDLQIVTDVEHVHNDRQFDAPGLQAQIEIAEWHGMRGGGRRLSDEGGDRGREHISLHDPDLRGLGHSQPVEAVVSMVTYSVPRSWPRDDADSY